MHRKDGRIGAPDRHAEAHALVALLNETELAMLGKIVGGYSLSAIAIHIDCSLMDAANLKAVMMNKIGASQTADLVRIGLYAQV